MPYWVQPSHILIAFAALFVHGVVGGSIDYKVATVPPLSQFLSA
jgi:hypothetical protein